MDKQPDPLSITFAALADPTRRAILARLANGEASVKDLAAQVESSSKAIMRTVGALDARVDAFSKELQAEGDAKGSKGAIHIAFAGVEQDVRRIGEAAQQSQATCARLGERALELEREVQQAMRFEAELQFVDEDDRLRVDGLKLEGDPGDPLGARTEARQR